MSTATTFGHELRRWRHARRLSQLSFANEAGVTARHICFLEGGRAQPSRAMVLRLADVLQIPREAKNTLLRAAGFAPMFSARARDAVDLAPLRSAVTRLMDRQDP